MRDEYTSKQQLTSRSLMRNENGKWIWNLMDEQMDFIMEMKMVTLMGSEFGKTI